MTIDMGEFRFREEYLRVADIDNKVKQYYSQGDSDGLVQHALQNKGLKNTVINNEMANAEKKVAHQIKRCKTRSEAEACRAMLTLGLALMETMKSGVSGSVLVDAPNSIFVASSMGNEQAIEILSRSSISDIWDACSPNSSRFFIETLLKADPILFISLMKECDSHVANRNRDKMERSTRLLVEGKQEYAYVKENTGAGNMIRPALLPSYFL